MDTQTPSLVPQLPDQLPGGVQTPAQTNLPSQTAQNIQAADQSAQSLLQALQNPPKRSLLDTIGASMSGFAAGAKGQDNPYLTRLDHEQSAKIERLKAVNEIQQKRAAKSLEDTKATRTVLEHLIETTEDKAQRDQFIDQYVKLGQQAGIETPQAIVYGWKNSGMKSERIAALARDIDSYRGPDGKVSPQDRAKLAQTYAPFGLSDTALSDMIDKLDPSKPNSQASRDFYKLPNVTENKSKAADLQKKTRDNWVGDHPEFADNEKAGRFGVAGYANEFTQDTYGRPLYSLSPDNPEDAKILKMARDYAYRRAEKTTKEQADQKFNEDIRMKQAESDIIRQREIAVAQARGEVGATKPMPVTARIKVLKPLDDADKGVGNLEIMRETAQNLNQKGFLPTGPTQAQSVLPRLKQWWNSNDVDILAMRQLTSPIMVGQIDRGMFDEKGSRSMQMFHAQIELVKNMPTLEGYNRLMDMYEYMYARMAQKTLRNLEAQEGHIDPTVIDEARRTFQATFPNGMPQDPAVASRGGRPGAGRTQPGEGPGMSKAETQPDGSRKVTLSDGTSRTVPAGQLLMRAPDGTLGAVPIGRRKDAEAKGYTLVR